ncbi:MAG: sigma 54-interacting transcriptional regulator [Pseudomonadota bacterium]
MMKPLLVLAAPEGTTTIPRTLAFLEFPAVCVDAAADLINELEYDPDGFSAVLLEGTEWVRSRDGRALVERLSGPAVRFPVLILGSDPETGVGAAAETGPLKHAALPQHLSGWLELWTTLRAIAAPQAHLAFDLHARFPGNGAADTALRNAISGWCECDDAFLVAGPPGTPRHSVAALVHRHSGRRNEPFIALDCNNLSAARAASELFGHRAGDFEGALSDHVGAVARAGSGTLFVDHASRLPDELQARLLGELHDDVDVRTGELSSRARLIVGCECPDPATSATTPGSAMTRLRQSQCVTIPSLSERAEALPAMLSAHLNTLSHAPLAPFYLDDAALRVLRRYTWPGNDDEFHNLIARLREDSAFRLVSDHDLPARIRQAPSATDAPSVADNSRQLEQESRTGPFGPTVQDYPKAASAGSLPSGNVDLRARVGELEKHLILWAIEQSDGVITTAASRLAINRTTLVEKMRKYRIPRNPVR